MSADLLARLIAAGTPVDLVGEVAMALARAETDAKAACAPTAGALRMRRYRERHGASPSVTCDASDAQVTHSVTEPPAPSPSFPPDPQTNPIHTPGDIPPAREASAKRSGFDAPQGVTDGQWRDFNAQRKKKLTPTAYVRLCTKLRKLATAGWPPGELIETAIERGWETIFEPRERHNGTRSAEPSGIGRTGAAGLDVFGHPGGSPH